MLMDNYQVIFDRVQKVIGHEFYGNCNKNVALILLFSVVAFGVICSELF